MHSLLVVAHAATYNGAERSLLEMIHAIKLKNSSIKIHVVFPCEGPIISDVMKVADTTRILFSPWWLDFERQHGVKTYSCFVVQLLFALTKMFALIIHLRPSVIITNTVCIPTGAIISKLLGIKHIWYLREVGDMDHGLFYLFGKQTSLKIIEKLSCQLIVNSDFIKDYYHKFILKIPISRVYQAVDIYVREENFIPVKKNFLQILLLGRFSEGKGQLEAVRAINVAIQKSKAIRLRLVGDTVPSNYSVTVKDYILKHALNDHVYVESFQHDPTNIFNDVDVVLVCSRCEAFGRVTIEAMKNGVPVIASNMGANPELIKDGFNGFLYEYGNPEDLAQKILLLEDEVLRNSLSLGAKQWSTNNFNFEKYSSELEKILKDYFISK